MRPHGKTKLGFYPLPVLEAERLRNCLAFPPEFSALDPCIGDGVAFSHLVEVTVAHRYGIEKIQRCQAGTSKGPRALRLCKPTPWTFSTTPPLLCPCST